MATETELLTIEATVREAIGTGHCTKLRKSGKLPAVLCQQGKSTSLSLEPKLLSKAWKNGRKFNLSLNGKTAPVMITELQLDHVKRLPVHVDLAYVK